MVNKDKKSVINEGRQVTSGKFLFGGFPRILNEAEAATQAFQDSPEQGQKNVATLSNSQEEDLYVPGAMGLRYPSKEYKSVAQTADEAHGIASNLNKELSKAKQSAYLQHMQGHYGRGSKHTAARALSFQHAGNPEMVQNAQQASAMAKELREKQYSHPHHEAFMQAAEEHSRSVRGGNYGE
jgi:hypothetical protein